MHVGTVDCLQGPDIKLTKNDSRSGGEHHLVPLDCIERVDTKVRLKKTAPDAMARWRSAA
jgi:hypothetical protein